jgi:hypothetical protein
MLPEHVQKTLDCMDALMKQPAIADLLVTLGVGQFTPNGKMAMPTPVRILVITMRCQETAARRSHS